MPFQIHALSPRPFAEFFDLDEAELAARQARRMIVETSPGTPCRVSLADAEVGETVILLDYRHQPADSPFRASHEVYVREGVRQAHLAVDEVPEAIRRRLISLRAFAKDGMMIDADVLEGADLAPALDLAFEDPTVDTVHLHYAKPGRFAASVTRPG